MQSSEHTTPTPACLFVNPRALDDRSRAALERHGFAPEQVLEFLDIVAPQRAGQKRDLL